MSAAASVTLARDGMRVAYFVGIYHRFTGSQRSLWLTLRAMDRARVEPIAVFPAEGYATRMYRELGIPVHVVEPAAPVLGRFGGELLAAGWLRRAAVAASGVAPYTAQLASFFRRERIDLLHANDPRAMLLAAPAARLLGIPVVFHVRGHLRRIGRLYTHACALLADRIVFVSDGIRDSVPAIHARKFRTVYNGVDPPAPPRRGRAELLGDGGGLVVAAIGSLVPFKGAHHLLAAVRALGDPRVRVVLVGDRPDEAYGRLLDERARGLDVRQVGWDPSPGDWFHAADVVCLPTIDREVLVLDGVGREVVHSEGFSRTVLEAMAHGRAVVATRVAGAAEQIVDGESGLLVPPSDVPALAAALHRLAGDPGLRSRLGAAAEARVAERFSLARTVTETLAIYEELAGARRKP
jgi:glycosyltransferase involved in cell wall biosynthesis